MIFQQEIYNIYRLKVPFEDLYTSVFLIKAWDGNVLVDCATHDKDVDTYILPAFSKIGLSIKEIKYLVLTHNHCDHIGGKKRILELNSNIKIIHNAGGRFLNGLTLCELKGHTQDCIGIFDEKTGTLLSGDGLQGAGVGKYRCSIESKEEYLKTIERIKQDKKVKNILFSHAYEPWYKDGAFGRKEVEKCLQVCKNSIKGE